MRKSGSRLLLLILSLIMVGGTLLPFAVEASVPYMTNSKDSYNRLIWTQSAYYPVGLLGKEMYIPDPENPEELKLSTLQNPKDVFIDINDEIYIADSGNNRIVHMDERGNVIRIIDLPENKLNKPEGVFVTDDGRIYIADTGNRRVLQLDREGNVQMEIHQPDTKFIPEGFRYDPIKLVVDKRDFIYIVTLGGYHGLLQLDPQGNFQSFFGANKTKFSPMDSLKRLLYTEEMWSRELSKLPGAISSVAIDRDGFVYTTTSGQDIDNEQIKKLNTRGRNMLAQGDEYMGSASRAFGEVRPFEYQVVNRVRQRPQLIDLTIDNNGNITAIDSLYKNINQYDSNGNLLFFWAGRSSATTTQLGLIKNPVAIASNSRNELFILDDQENVLQHFRLSEFGELVHRANGLTIQGRYEESEPYWQEIIRLNSSFSPAILGLAKAAYKKGEFHAAMDLFREGGNQKGYSDSFWQIRLVWFQRNFSWLATTILLSTIALMIGNKYTQNLGIRVRWRNRQRSKHPIMVQVRHVFHTLKHPLDGFSALRFENKGNYITAFMILFLVFASIVISQIYTGFTFNRVVIQQISVGSILTQFLAIWVCWIVANYLISSIYRGEGRFRDVIIGTSYALLPMILVGLPLTLVSNFMTESESAIYGFLQNGMYVWTALMVFWKVQSTQNYSFGETVVNIGLTILTMIMLVVLVFLIFGLSTELYDFIYNVYLEVSLR